MKKIRKMTRCGFVFLLSLVMLMQAAVTAFAAETPDLDLTSTGSIHLTLADADGNKVTGGAVTLYQVASLSLDDGDMAYAFTEAFSDCTAVLNIEDTGLAAQLAAYAEEKSLGGTTTAVGSGGEVSFGGLELGLYLIVQTEESENYEVITPFVVTVPMDEGDAWVYDVDASPKVGTVTVTEETTTPQETTTTETETTTSEATTAETTTAETTAQAETTTQPTKLAQTGQLNWPIPVLAAAGLLLFLAGLFLSRSDERKHTDAS